jgi:hypothetical protein
MNTSITPPTIASSPLDTGAIANRVAICAQLLAALPEKPAGPTLIYEVPDTKEVRALPLYMDEIIIGRVPLSSDDPNGSHLAFPESKKLSSIHFAIRRRGDGFILEDLESKNGTYVNTDPSPVKTRVLVETDLISAGGIRFAYVEA